MYQFKKGENCTRCNETNNHQAFKLDDAFVCGNCYFTESRKRLEGTFPFN